MAQRIWESFVELRATVGVKFLLFVSLAIHLNKGFGDSFQYRIYPRLLKFSEADMNGLYPFTDMALHSKPLIAFLSDMYPVVGYRRMPYMLLSIILSLIGFLICFCSGSDTTLLLIGAMLAQVSVAWVDILVQGAYSEIIALEPSVGPAMIAFVWIGQFPFMPLGEMLPLYLLPPDWEPSNIFYPKLWLLLALFPNLLLIIPIVNNWMGEAPISSLEVNQIRIHQRGTREMMLLSVTFYLLAVVLSGQDLVNPALGLDQSVPLVPAVSLLLGTCLAFFFLRRELGVFCLVTAVVNAIIISPERTKQTFFEEKGLGPMYFIANQTVCLLGIPVCLVLAGYAYKVSHRDVYGFSLVCRALGLVWCGLMMSNFPSRLHAHEPSLLVGMFVFTEIFFQTLWMSEAMLFSKFSASAFPASTYAILATIGNMARELGDCQGDYLDYLLPSTEGKELSKVFLVLSALPVVVLPFALLVPATKHAEPIPVVNRANPCYRSPYRRLGGLFKKERRGGERVELHEGKYTTGSVSSYNR